LDLAGLELLWSSFVADFDDICRVHDATWQKRRRVVDSKMLVILILKSVWSKGNVGFKIVLAEFWRNLKSFGIVRWQKTPIAASSLTDARQKLDEAIFKELNRRLTLRYDQSESWRSTIWNDLRLFGVDGSVINVPRGLASAGYGMRNPKSHYPLALISCLYDLRSGIPYDFDLNGHMNERKSAEEHLAILGPGDLVIYDRGYFSYAMLMTHADRNVGALFRIKSSKNFAEIQKFIDNEHQRDGVITIFPDNSQTKHGIRKSHPDIQFRPLEVRIIKRMINGKMWIFATTLLDKKIYAAREIAAIYQERWGLEELFKAAKVHINFEEFHSRSERGVKQEVYGAFLLITMARLVSRSAETFPDLKTSGDKKATPKQQPWKVNFKAALTLFVSHLERLILPSIGKIKTTLGAIRSEMSRIRQKIRPGRKFERRSMLPVNKWRRFTVNSSKVVVC